MDNVKTLRDDLIKAYKELRTGAIGISEAKGLANMAGKIMSTAKTQMEFNKMTGNNKRNIKFLVSNE
jgi:hypothetical protein